ncbi:MAG: Rrf2 family transcriptional regulator [Firmicutes bacterium]|nr:Rrf2 family transcriptional regulator [Bacillota bacterium]
MPMQFTRKAEYAILALVDLARQPRDQWVLSKDVAERQRIPVKWMPQIMGLLARGKYVEGARGSHGGVRLIRDPDAISLRQVVELVDGPIAINRCLAGQGICSQQSSCPLHGVWAQAQAEMVRVLESTSIGKLAWAQQSMEQATPAGEPRQKGTERTRRADSVDS